MSADEIVVGTVSDLCGPIAMLGVPVRDGMLMRFDEANAAGGVHGRRIRLAVEDAGYDPKRAVLAARSSCSTTRPSPSSPTWARRW